VEAKEYKYITPVEKAVIALGYDPDQAIVSPKQQIMFPRKKSS